MQVRLSTCEKLASISNIIVLTDRIWHIPLAFVCVIAVFFDKLSLIRASWNKLTLIKTNLFMLWEVLVLLKNWMMLVSNIYPLG